MTETKGFPIGHVLSITTGKLMAENGANGLCEILEWMSGERLLTHQLLRVMNEAAPVILAAHPHLEEAKEMCKDVNGENYHDRINEIKRKFGDKIIVPRLTDDQHERIEPRSELVEKVHPDKIIEV